MHMGQVGRGGWMSKGLMKPAFQGVSAMRKFWLPSRSCDISLLSEDPEEIGAPRTRGD